MGSMSWKKLYSNPAEKKPEHIVGNIIVTTILETHSSIFLVVAIGVFWGLAGIYRTTIVYGDSKPVI